MPLAEDVKENDERMRKLQEKPPLKQVNAHSSAEVRRESVLSVKQSWHWLRSNLWVLPLTHTHIWLSAGHSLLQPFFPPLAAAKAIPAWKYGFTFSTFKAAMAIGSIVSRSLISGTSAKFAYLFGLTGFFVGCVSLALLYWCPTAASLLGGSIAAASLAGFMEGVYIVTLYAICTDTFLHNTGVIIAIMDGMFGIGCMLGSGIGGALIDLWAFPLPYFVCGVLLMSVVPYFIAKGPVPQVQQTDPSSSTESELKFSYYRLFANPRFMINMGSVSLTFVMLGFYEPTLEPYLRQFQLSSTKVGTIFMVTFGSYWLGAASAGIFCHFKQEAFFEFFGVFVGSISFFVVGPAPFLPLSPIVSVCFLLFVLVDAALARTVPGAFAMSVGLNNRSLWLIYLSQVCVGFSAATLFTSCYCNAYKVALECGYPEAIETSAFVSSSTILSQVIGAIFTPPTAGYIVEAVGFRDGTMVMFGVLLFWMPFAFGLWMHSICRNVKKTHWLS